ncbi:MAG TPA: GDSL-type esterase/lipase family protein [Candidatus Saccharimonadales bacterium]|nr:GDSL-type esterase/lipase family protein [Candidatus Saccharimonadales bacterium]
MKISLPFVKKPQILAAILAVVALAYTFLYPDSTHKVLSEATTARPTRTIKIMPLGDSIIAGGNAEYKNGFRPDLLKNLHEYKIDYVGSYKEGLPGLDDWDTQAQAGACIRATPCTTSMFEQTHSWVDAFKPDIVIMQGGTNDFSRGRENQDPQIVRNALRDWVNEVWRAKPDAYIVVIGAPHEFLPYKQWIPGYVAFEQALGKRISYVPLDGVEKDDIIHPNLAGYKTLAGRLATTLRPILERLAAQ